MYNPSNISMNTITGGNDHSSVENVVNGSKEMGVNVSKVGNIGSVMGPRDMPSYICLL